VSRRSDWAPTRWAEMFVDGRMKVEKPNVAPPRSGPARRGGVAENAQSARATAGEVFADHTQLALVQPAGSRELQLLRWDGKSSQVVAEVEHAGQVYRPIKLDSSVGLAITFPSHAEKYGSAVELFRGIRDRLLRCHNLEEESAALLTCALGTSWFADCLPVAPCISISSAAVSDAVRLLQHLACYARFSVVLGEPTSSGLQFLPANFPATRLVHQFELQAKTQRMLNLASYRGLAVPGRGRLFSVYGVTIVAGPAHPPLLGSAIRIALGLRTGTQERFGAPEQQEFAAYYQPRLLQYRFDHYDRVAASSFDVPEFSFPLREVARSLGMCIEDPALRSNLVGFLQAQDKQSRLEQALDLNAIAIEAALFFCHDPAEEKEWVLAKECAEIANVILGERGEILEITPKRMGAILNNLGLFTEKVGKAGRGIHLTEGARRRVHRLAREHKVLSVQSGTQYCRHCGEDDEAQPGTQRELREHSER